MYSHKEYSEIYEKLDGVTTYFMPVIGQTSKRTTFLSRTNFIEKLTRLDYLLSRDDESIDELESAAWEIIGLKVDLLLCEKLHPYYDVYS